MSQEKTKIKGQLDHITYTNEDNGFTVARIILTDSDEKVTVVGNLPAPEAGQVVELEGQWTTHPKYGRQFEISSFDIAVPTSEEGVEKYLGSGLIPGIGPVMAERIVAKFGEEALEIIDNNPAKLKQVEGIGEKRYNQIIASWQKQSDIREIMVFLLSQNISPTYAARIYQEYGQQAVQIIENNPYQLASDIWGIGFKTVDKIAQDMGIDRESRQRVKAGLLYILEEKVNEGHVYFPYKDLLAEAEEILEVSKEIVTEAFAELELEDDIVVEDLNEDIINFEKNNKAVYLKPFYIAEKGISKKLKKLNSFSQQQPLISCEDKIDELTGRLAINLAPRQREAIKLAVREKLLVITGGPGTGKTTIIKAIINIYQDLQKEILLAAPTGRAAKKMSETTGREAKTIHRLLEYNYYQGGFQRGREKQLDGDVFIIDEASMLDIILMYNLLKAIPREAVLILVGDVNQLPPVGAGYALKDIINSQEIAVVKLKKIFRQAKESTIVLNSHRINKGQLPSKGTQKDQELDDYYFIEEKNQEKISRLINKLVKERIPTRFSLDPIEDVQVLSPLRQGKLGINSLNQSLQQSLNPRAGKDKEKGLQHAGRTFFPGDKVMQIKNNYELEVFNGDIGRVQALDREKGKMLVNYSSELLKYDKKDLKELELAYAITVHKSQGSEYPAIIFPLVTSHYIMLQRNLLYTALTRGKELAIIIGEYKAMAIAVNNDKVEERFSLLERRLKEKS